MSYKIHIIIYYYFNKTTYIFYKQISIALVYLLSVTLKKKISTIVKYNGKITTVLNKMRFIVFI